MLDTQLTTLTTDELFVEVNKRFKAFIFVGDEILPGTIKDPVIQSSLRFEGSIPNVLGLLYYGQFKFKEMLSDD